MKNINLKQIGIGLLILVVVALIMQKCNNDKYQRLAGEYKALKEQYSAQKETVKKTEEKRKKEKDSLSFIISQREVANTLLNKENTSLKNKINTIKEKPIKQPKDLQGLANYFNEKYETTSTVVLENKVALVKDVARDVTWDLEEGDKALEIVPIQEEYIKNQDSVISNLSKDKVDLSNMLFSAEKEIKEKDDLNNLAEQNIQNLENQVKKQKNKNFWNKVLIIGGTVGGVILGKQL